MVPFDIDVSYAIHETNYLALRGSYNGLHLLLSPFVPSPCYVAEMNVSDANLLEETQ
ncbi:hypothetical protein KSX_31830 [Ktedonospora formicarum]|uniref:Uncharacterized protein n=1 Tax=Ktedonospora formicarum TaxID=2778364 RepID=A0A8J3MU37_9CHLR|nr:hypothetical protein KSX_31830 [Ktedonospora formicarum]